MKIARIVRWEDLDYSLALEYTPLSAADKISNLKPDLLIVQEGIQHIDAHALFELAHQANPSMRVIYIGAAVPVDHYVVCIPDLDPQRFCDAVMQADAEEEKAAVWESALSLPDVCNCDGNLRILRFLGRFASFPAAEALLRERFLQNLLSVKPEADGSLTVLLRDNHMAEAGTLFHTSQTLYQLFLSTAKELSSVGVCYCVLSSECIPSVDARYALEKLAQYEKYAYFCTETTVLTEKYILECGGKFDYELAEDKTRELLESVITADAILTVRTIEDIFFRLLQSSFSFEARDFCLTCFNEVFQIIGSMIDISPKEPLHHLASRKPAVLKEECEIVTEQFLSLLRQFEARSIHEKVIQALLYVGKHSSMVMSLTDVASALAITTQYLSRIFKEDLGICFTDYLNRVRVSRAKELMITGESRINVISGKVGFADTKYFARVFKALAGQTPSQYAAAVQNSKRRERTNQP